MRGDIQFRSSKHRAAYERDCLECGILRIIHMPRGNRPALDKHRNVIHVGVGSSYFTVVFAHPMKVAVWHDRHMLLWARFWHDSTGQNSRGTVSIGWPIVASSLHRPASSHSCHAYNLQRSSIDHLN